MWILLGLTASAVIAATYGWSRRGRQPDLGFVSQQWIAEHRLSHPNDYGQ